MRTRILLALVGLLMPLLAAAQGITNDEAADINISYDIDPDLEVTLYYEGHEYSNVLEFPTKVLKGATIKISVRSSNGIPVIYIDGRFYDLGGWSIINYIYPEDGTSIKIENVKFSDLIDLDVHLDSPGTLAEKITQEQAHLVNSLKITGTFNQDDLWYINNQFPVIRKLDLSNALISEENEGVFGTALSWKDYINEIYLPENTKEIAVLAFQGLAISKIIIPKSVEKIRWGAFNWCDYLKTVVVKSDKPIELEEGFASVFFSNTPLKEKGTLYVPKGSKEAYMNADEWKDFPNIIEYEGEWQDADGIEGLKISDGEITVYSLNGAAVYKGRKADMPEHLKGLYIVKLGGKAVKCRF